MKSIDTATAISVLVSVITALTEYYTQHAATNWMEYTWNVVRTAAMLSTTCMTVYSIARLFLWLNNTFNTAADFFRKKPIIAQRPDAFSNRMDATDWLNRMERYFHSLGVISAADKAETLLDNMAYTERLKFVNVGARKDADRYENLRQTMVRAQGPPSQSNSTLKTQFYSRKQQPDETVTSYYLQLQMLAAKIYLGRPRSEIEQEIKKTFMQGVRNANIRERLIVDHKNTPPEQLVMTASTHESDIIRIEQAAIDHTPRQINFLLNNTNIANNNQQQAPTMQFILPPNAPPWYAQQPSGRVYLEPTACQSFRVDDQEINIWSNTNGRYHKYVRLTNMQAGPQLTEDVIRLIHRADVGNIFDLSVFRQPIRNMATANVTLWNRARHDELIEALDRQSYRDRLIRCRGSHEVDRIDRPITTDTRVPTPADAHHDAHTYSEPQTGPYEAAMAEWTRRRAVPRQKATMETRTVITTRTFIKPIQVTIPNDHRTPIQRRTRTPRFDPIRRPSRQLTTAQAESEPRQEHVPPADDEPWD
jgi:hypothetical protein